MNTSLSKKIILYFFVFAWIVFSTAYIIWDIWTNFKNIQMLNAYQQGRADTIDALIVEVEKCQPVPIFSAEKQIQLIGVNCLETAKQ